MGDPLAPCAHVGFDNKLVDHVFENCFHKVDKPSKALADGHKEGDPVTTTGPFGLMLCHTILPETDCTSDTENL